MDCSPDFKGNYNIFILWNPTVPGLNLAMIFIRKKCTFMNFFTRGTISSENPYRKQKIRRRYQFKDRGLVNRKQVLIYNVKLVKSHQFRSSRSQS